MTVASEIEQIIAAVENVEIGYKMDLVRLVDGVSTYRLKVDGRPDQEFASTDECYAAIRSAKSELKAKAIIAALDAAGYVCVPKEPTDAMIEAGYNEFYEWTEPDHDAFRPLVSLGYRAMIEASK